ncbi:hypothetical protein SBRCBS47491_001412 [Sporothrix bragantina]|uniref:BZIP transcription factor n=1 Tax=Sporothrix bragantina TaxID=671064 RepID=A0ABP0AYE5_9PEZI
MDDALHIRPVKTDGRSSATASSRAAANLSMERLYRKRAIDRENQRVLRQKNKARLAELETEVRTLTERLAQAEADRAQVAARTQTSSSSLDSIISSLQSLQVSLASASAAAAASSSAGSVMSDGDDNRTPGSSSSPVTATASPAGAAGPTRRMTTSASPAPVKGHPYASETLNLNLDNIDFWSSGASVTVPVDDSNPFENTDYHHGLPPLNFGTNGLRNTPGSIDFQAPSPPPPTAAGDSLRRNPHDDTGAVYLARAEANRLREVSPVWAVTPAYVPPTCNVDELIINLVYKRRHEGGGNGVGSVGGGRGSPTRASVSTATTSTASVSAASTSATSAANTSSSTMTNSTSTASSSSAAPHSDEFTHANFPSVNSLLNPVLYEPDKPIASTIARHVAGTIMLYTTPEKTALLYMMCIYIRWLIAPTREHYDSIPEFFRPTAAQLAVPHPFWIDTLGWPRVRERLVNQFDHTRYRDFASIILKSFSIGWPHHALEGILEGSNERGFVMTRAFIQHVRDPKNWTVGPELAEAFPFLEGAYNVRGRPPVSF